MKLSTLFQIIFVLGIFWGAKTVINDTLHVSKQMKDDTYIHIMNLKNRED